MKVIKLDQRYKLKHQGYDWAFRFDSRAYKRKWKYQDLFDIEQIVDNIEGDDQSTCPRAYYSKRKNGYRSYYIGFNKETTASIILLKFGEK